MDINNDFTDKLARQIIQLALEEDKVSQDVTTNSLLNFDNLVTAEVYAKAEGVISGTGVFKQTFHMVDPEMIVDILLPDGSAVKKGDVVIKIRGNESSILKAERAALNFLQRLSGIATLTRQYVERLKGTTATLLDTRKTTPGMRYMEKKAVLDGGGSNHRLNLEDMAMIKDNHIEMAEGIANAVKKVRQSFPGKKIEVEVKNLEELEEALSLNVEMIMLDNFDPPMQVEAVKLTAGRAKLEVSGNVTLENIAERASSGIDYISVGALTHSFKSLDLSLLIKTGQL